MKITLEQYLNKYFDGLFFDIQLEDFQGDGGRKSRKICKKMIY